MPDSDEDQIQDEPPPLPLWQEIQKRTFTNWVNLRLAPSFISDLFTDMSDGLQLIKLIEVLTEKNLGRRNKRIEHVNQRLDNVAIALDFLQDKEGINLTNIGPADIVERNPKLILGLMWILFRHYTIAKALPMLPHESGQKSNDKTRLLQWIRSKLPTSFPVSNLTSDWNDGFALAALVEGCVPGLKVGWKDWDPTTPLENTKKAMDLAHEHLNVDKVISPEDLISSDVDEISVMAYLANFPLMVEAKKVRGFLNNVDRHPIAGNKSAFNVRIVDASHSPKVEVTKVGDDPQSIPIELAATNDPHIFDVSYVPPVAGPYEVSLKVTTPEESPDNRKSDASLKVDVLEGPGLKGLNPHPFIGEPQFLKIYNSNPQDTVRIEIIGPESSRIHVPLNWNPVAREFEGTFTPQKPGHHSVNVLCNSRNIKGSPFPVRVQELPGPEFWGRGICDNLRAGEPAIVYAEYPKHVLPADAQRFLAGAKLKVQANNREVPVKEEVKDNQKIFTYTPEDVCTHYVTTVFNGKELGKHSVNAQYPSTLSKAYGPGTESGMEKQKAVFVIDRADNEEIQFAIEGPAPSDLKRLDLDDNIAVVEYTPLAPGKYYVTVCDNEGQNVKNSPFAVNVGEEVQGFYPGKAKISEIPRVVKVNEVVQFTADTRPAHSLVRTPELVVYDPDGEKVETRVQSKHDGTYKCSFCPRIVGHHKLFVTLDGVNIAPCPVLVTCVDPEKVLYSGPGIDEPAPYPSPNQTHFVIDAKQAGPGHVEVEMVDNEEQKVDVEVMDEKDGSYTVKYRAPKPGAYKIKVVFAGFPLPSFEINVQQPADASGARVEGLDNAIVTVNTEKEVHVFTSNGENTRIVIKSPSGQLIEAFIESTSHGFSFKFTPSEIGDYTIDVTYEDYPIADSPFFLHSVPPLSSENDLSAESEYFVMSSGPPNADMVRVAGPGLGPIIPTGKSTSILIDATKAGFGNIDVFVDGPTRTPIHCIDNEDGTCSMHYVPCVSGIYWIRVLFDSSNVPGSPFQVFASPKENDKSSKEPTENNVTDASKCFAYGDGLSRATVGELSSFNVDTSNAGPGDLAFIVEGPNSSRTIVDYTPGNCSAVYTPTHPGEYQISTLFGTSDEDRKHIPGSPFTVIADYPRDSSQITVLDPNSGDSVHRVAKGVTNSFIVDATRTAKDDIVPEVTNLSPNDLVVTTELEPKIWRVDYTLNAPTGRKVPINLQYGNELLSLGPLVEVVDYLPENLKILGVNSTSPDNLEVVIELDPRDIGSFNRLTGRIEKLDDTVPSQPVSLLQNPDGTCTITAKPDEPGEYGLKLYADGHLVNENPITFAVSKSGPAKDCAIKSVPDEWVLNKPQDILIEHGGEKERELSVLNEGLPDDLDVEIYTVNAADVLDKPLNTSKFEIVRLIPKKIQPYHLQLALDDQKIPDSDFKFVPKDYVSPKQSPADEFLHPRAYSFALGPENADKKITAFAIDPDQKLVPLEVTHIDKLGNAKVTGVFKKLGRHSVFLLADGELLPKHVLQELVSKQTATAQGPGLEAATVGKPATFDIVCPDRGQVKVNVKGPKGVKIEMEQKLENSCTVHWTPEVPGNYEILIFLNKSEEPAAGSPYVVKVLPVPISIPKKTASCFSCATPSEVTFDCGKDINKEHLTANVRAPDGKVSNCEVRLLGNNKIGLSLKPKLVGDYKFTVLEKGQELPHSPFYVKVGKNDLPNPSKVRIFGEGLKKAVAGMENEFFIDTTKSGYGSVVVSIDGPADAPISCVRTEDNLLRILYTPPLPGNYQITVAFDDKALPNCPYTVDCIPVLSPIHKKPSSPKAVPVVDSSRKAEIHMFIPNGEAGRLQATIVDPNDHKSTSTVEKIGNGFYSIQLKPVHFGKYSVYVTQEGKDIQGSPFIFEAGQRQPSNADKVKVTGPGIEYGQAGILQTFVIHTEEAGSGVVNAIIDGPEPVRAKLKDLRDGRVVVEYTAFTPGHYFITILFNGTAIKDTPYCVYLAPNKSLSTKKKQNGVSPIQATPISVSKQKVQNIHSEQQRQSIDSSSPVSPGARITPTKLVGEGLKQGTTGQKSEFDILPIRLTESNYSIEIFGPSRVDLSTENTKDGIRVNYIPYAPGDYIITVRNDGVNVDGSPKKVRVEGKALGGKGINESTVIYTKFISHKTTTVTTYGNGNGALEDKPLTRVKRIETSSKEITVDGVGVTQFTPGKNSMFRIYNVGCQTLFVGVITAHGPCQQVSVNNCGNGSFLVSYMINDRTPGYIYIRYGNEDIPNSPFKTLPTFR